MNPRALPTPQDVARFLEDLLGRGVTIQTQAAKVVRHPCVTATYAVQGGQLGAILWCDLSFAASVAAALSMLPVARAEEAVKIGKIDDAILENFREVCNVFASLLNNPAQEGLHPPSLLLHEVHVEPKTKESAVQLESSKKRLDLAVSVKGYKDGKLSLSIL